jgi:hypothetical protein
VIGPQRYDGRELAAVLAAALLGLDDDAAPPTVRVSAGPTARLTDVAGVVYDPATNELVLEVGPRPPRPWLVESHPYASWLRGDDDVGSASSNYDPLRHLRRGRYRDGGE